MTAPAPLTPPGCDLRDFPWMELHVARLLESDFNRTLDDTGWRLGFTLWLRSWHEVPAASLPNSDPDLAALAGLGRDVKTWAKHRATALRGFVLCSDGRLYHPVVAEFAGKAWERKQAKLAEREKTRERVRKHRQKQGPERVTGDGVTRYETAEDTAGTADGLAEDGDTSPPVTRYDGQCNAENGRTIETGESVVTLRSTTASGGGGRDRWRQPNPECTSWDDDAQGVALHFLDRREVYWPGHPDNVTRTPLTTLLAEAEQWVAQMPPSLIREVVARGMHGMAAKRDPNPPTLLKAFRKSLSSAAVNHAAALTNHPAAGGSHGNQHRQGRNERPGEHARRSTIAAVVSEFLDDGAACAG